jgi:hypothetical protein
VIRVLAKWFLVAVSVALTGCAAPATTLVNDEGRRAHCGYWGWGVFGVVGAVAMHQHCISKSEAAGFRRLASRRGGARTNTASASASAP